MKKNVLLLLLTASLLVGCSKSGTLTSEPVVSSDVTEPAESSEPEEPEEVTPDEYDATYPIEDDGTVPVDEEAFEVLLNHALGEDYANRIFRDYLGEERYEALLSCNHFKEEELGQFTDLITDIMMFTSQQGPKPAQIVKFVKKVASINVDAAVATLRSVAENPVAKSAFSYIFNGGARILNGKPITYQEADKFFNSTDAGISAAAANEKTMLEHFIDFSDDPQLMDSIIDIIQDNGLLSALRFVKHVGDSANENLSDEEFEFLVISIGGSDQYKERQQELMAQFFADTAAAKAFIQHAGKFLTNMNMNVASWAQTIPVIEKFAIVSATSDYKRSKYPVPYKNAYNMKSVISSTVFKLKPISLRSLIKFFGLVGKNVSEREIDCFLNNPVDEQGQPAIPLTAVTNYYNRMFGLLTEEEKNELDAAFYAFGVDLPQFNSDLDAVAESNDPNALMGLVQTTFAAIGSHFNVETDYVETQDGNPLYLRQGDAMDQIKFINMLKSEDFFRISRWDGNTSRTLYDDPSLRSYTMLSTFDTSTPGVKEIRFQMSWKFTYEDNGQQILVDGDTKEFLLEYYVIPQSVTFFSDYLQMGAAFAEDYIGYSIISDGNGHRLQMLNGSRLLIEKGASYTQEQLYGMTMSSDLFFYSEEQGRYISANSEFVQSNEEFSVDLSSENANFNTIGSHYISGYQTISLKSEGEPVKVKIPVFFTYEVVNKIVGLNNGDEGHIELD